jgi:hypothetical protein
VPVESVLSDTWPKVRVLPVPIAAAVSTVSQPSRILPFFASTK